MMRYSLIVLSSFVACSIQDEPSSSAVTAIGDVMRVEVDLSSCNQIMQRTVELDVAAAGADLVLEGLTLEGTGFDGELAIEGASVPADHGFRIRCVDRLQVAESLGDLVVGESEANVLVAIATNDASAEPTLIATVTTQPRAFDNCQNVFVPEGCTLVSEF